MFDIKLVDLACTGGTYGFLYKYVKSVKERVSSLYIVFCGSGWPHMLQLLFDDAVLVSFVSVYKALSQGKPGRRLASGWKLWNVSVNGCGVSRNSTVGAFE